MARARIFALALVPVLAFQGCGGSTSNGGGSSGTGATSTGGTGGTAGCNSANAPDCIDACGHYTAAVCSDGHWECGPSSCADASVGGSGGCAAGGGIDCVDSCSGQMYSPDCVNGNWVCAPTTCTDAGIGGTSSGGSGGCGDPGGVDCYDACNGTGYSPDCVNGTFVCLSPLPCSCPPNQVGTPSGCQNCSEATAGYATALENARQSSASCSTPSDCTLVSASTNCQGACPVAVAAAQVPKFQALLMGIEATFYCPEFATVCGYSTPKCANATLACSGGLCEAVYN